MNIFIKMLLYVKYVQYIDIKHQNTIMFFTQRVMITFMDQYIILNHFLLDIIHHIIKLIKEN